jgi:hypothetical protein
MKNILIINLLWLMTGNLFAQNLADLKTPLKDKKPFEVSGSVGLGYSFYGVNGIENRQPNQLMLSGNVNVRVYGWEIPVAANFSNQQLNVSYRQPFNQIGISPSYKWLKIHAGYRNITFSPFTLAGHTFLGGGIELTPGKFRFGAVYGRFLKATLENEALNNTTELFDKVTFSAYERRAFAAKIGYGTATNYFDIIVLKGNDEINSLPESQKVNAAAPAENLVVGISPQFTFFKKISWKSNLALSLFTRDVRSEAVNVQNIPLAKAVSSFFTPRTSTHYYWAGESNVTARFKKGAVGVKYRRIDPDYQSMGAYFFQTDLEQWTVNPSLSALKGTLSLTGSLGLQQDNLLNHKNATTHRQIYLANVSWQPTEKWGLDLQFSNFGISQTPGIRKLSDTVRIAQITRNISITPHYLIANELFTHSIMLISSYQEMIDRNSFTSSLGNFTFQNHSLTYIFTNNKSGLSLTESINYNEVGASFGKTQALGISSSATKSFFDNKLNTDLNINYNINRFEGVYNGSTLGLGLNISYAPMPKHNFSANMNVLNNKSNDETVSPTFTEFIGQLQYVLSF